VVRAIPVTFWARAWQSIGGQAAGSFGAARLFMKQLAEMVHNKELNPVLIQWSATADPTGYNSPDPYDGWYIVGDFVPDYSSFIVSGQVKCRMNVSFVAPGPPASLAMVYDGGAILPSNYSGTPQTAIGFPIGSANQPASLVTRAGGEGAIPVSVAPTTKRLLFTPGTNAQLFMGGCRVYDTQTVGGNAVPTGGAFTHASWVQVYGTDHLFTGDVIITNGLHLYRIQTGITNVVGTAYFWSTAQTPPGWLQFTTFTGLENSETFYYTARSFTVERVGLEEVRIAVRGATTNGQWQLFTMRLGRGMLFSRVDITALTQANTAYGSLLLTTTNPYKIFYNSAKIGDVSLGEAELAVPADYGYAAAFRNNVDLPCIFGLLHQNQPSNGQGYYLNTSTLILDDRTGPGQNATRSYGIIALPYGTSTDTTQRLQAEVESLTLTGAAVSVADGAASGGNAMKIPSGTAIAGARALGPSIVGQAGAYNIAFRVRSGTNGAGNNTELRLAAITNSGGTFVGITLLKPNQVTTTYAWFLLAGGPFTEVTNFQFIADDTGVAGAASVDWFVDEAVLLPVTLSGANTGPQEIAQQFATQPSARLVRL
jgi:hypothetical protein